MRWWLPMIQIKSPYGAQQLAAIGLVSVVLLGMIIPFFFLAPPRYGVPQFPGFPILVGVGSVAILMLPVLFIVLHTIRTEQRRWSALASKQQQLQASIAHYPEGHSIVDFYYGRFDLAKILSMNSVIVIALILSIISFNDIHYRWMIPCIVIPITPLAAYANYYFLDRMFYRYSADTQRVSDLLSMAITRSGKSLCMPPGASKGA
jgi:hypothetical protein